MLDRFCCAEGPEELIRMNVALASPVGCSLKIAAFIRVVLSQPTRTLIVEWARAAFKRLAILTWNNRCGNPRWSRVGFEGSLR